MNKKIDRKEVILSVAQRKFARYGLHKTTIDEIAKDARISKGLIYHYYSSKEDIFYAVINKEVKYLESLIRKAISREITPQKKLETFIKTRLNRMLEVVNLNELNKEVVKILIPEIEKGLINYRKKEIKIVSSIIKEGMRNGDFKKVNPDKTAFIFLSLFRGLEIPFIVDKILFDIGELVDFSLKIFFDGIKLRK